MSDMTNKTVPVEPTWQMMEAGLKNYALTDSVESIYKAMLEAAPPSPVTELEVMQHEALKIASENAFGFYKPAREMIDAALAAFNAKKEVK